MTWVVIATIGLGVGFTGGLFGKGGAAIATPLLAAAGVPPMVAVAAPLPAAIPSSIAAFSAYRDRGHGDRRVVRWSLAVGVPATLAGAVLTRWIDASSLIALTDVLLIGVGLRFSCRTRGAVNSLPRVTPVLVAFVATAAGLISGLLANAGGFLLAPLYLSVLRLPVKPAFASSLAVAAVLAIPGTVVHAALGHIDWRVVAVFAATSVPLARVGARAAVATDAARLERWYGIAMVVLGSAFLLVR